MKRYMFALATIGFTSIALADQNTVNTSAVGGFIFGVTGFYLQPSATDNELNYATLTPQSTTAPFSQEVRRINPGYDWDWGANVGYIFPHTGNDINLSYFQFSSDDTGFTAINPNIGTISPINFFFNNDAGLLINSASAKTEFDINEVDLTAGQYINVGQRVSLHPFAGAQYDELQGKLDAAFFPDPSSPASANETLVNNQKSKFQGAGPVVGIDGSYYLDDGVGVVAHFSSALLVGNMDLNNQLNIIDPRNIRTVAFNFNTDSSDLLVPELSGKLGANYTYLFSNKHTNLSLEAGYQVSHYFNALQYMGVVANFPAQSLSTGARIAFRKSADLDLNGPYVSLVLHT